MKLQEGDIFLVTSPYLREKATIVSIEKSRDGVIYVLDNQVKMTEDLKPLNSRVSIEPWDEERYAHLIAKAQIQNIMDELSRNWKNWDEETQMKFHQKLLRLRGKFLSE